MEGLRNINLLANSLTFEKTRELCEKLINHISLKRNDLLNYVDEEICKDLFLRARIQNYKKQQELREILVHHPELKFTYVEDWKDENKLKFMALLISLNYVDQNCMHEIVGNKSKKTYRNGIVINDQSLSLQKFFDKDFRSYAKDFNRALVNIVSKIATQEDKEYNKIENSLFDMVFIIQSEVICRDKYNKEELEDYKQKILDIIETREKEDVLYDLFNKITYLRLVNDNPNHEPLKFLLFNSWTETKERYLWLTELITYINNESKESKEYLVNVIGVRDHQNHNKNIVKCNLIEDVAEIKNLNMNMIKYIKNYMFSKGNYHKHRTYNKWYMKELEAIKLFEKYKNIELSTNIKNLIEENTVNEDIKVELENLFQDYYENVKRFSK